MPIIICENKINCRFSPSMRVYRIEKFVVSYNNTGTIAGRWRSLYRHGKHDKQNSKLCIWKSQTIF